MPQTNQTRPAGGAAGLGNVDLRAANDTRDNVPNPEKIQETIAHLKRDFAAETLQIAALKASHAADDQDAQGAQHFKAGHLNPDGKGGNSIDGWEGEI